MRYVMKIMGLARGSGVTRFDEQYVVEYDPARPGAQPDLTVHLVCSPHLADARRFADVAELQRYWRQESGRPYPADRPLTAYTLMIEQVDDDGNAVAEQHAEVPPLVVAWQAGTTADDWEQVFHAALERGDLQAVEVALRVLAVKDPQRAVLLVSLLRAAA